MFEAYFCPFFASMLLAMNPDYVVSEDTQFIVDFFFYGQIFQVIGFAILNFTIPFRYLGNPLRNKYMPEFLFGLTYFVFMFVPISKSLVYMFFLYLFGCTCAKKGDIVAIPKTYVVYAVAVYTLVHATHVVDLGVSQRTRTSRQPLWRPASSTARGALRTRWQVW